MENLFYYLSFYLGHTNFHIVISKQELQMYLNYFVSLDLLLRRRSHTECKKCTDILGSVGKLLQLFVDEKSHKYFDLINRDGLTFSSNFLFIVTQFAYLIYNVCISTLETEFLQLSHQKQTYLVVVERFITGHEDCTDIHSICDSCGATQLKVIIFLERSFFIVSEQKNRQKITNKYNIHNYIQNTKIKNKQHTS